MSVINSMLKDLEKRKVQLDVSGDDVLKGLTVSDIQKTQHEIKVKHYQTSIAGVMFIIAIMVIGYFISPYNLMTVSEKDLNKIAEMQVEVDDSQSKNRQAEGALIINRDMPITLKKIKEDTLELSKKTTLLNSSSELVEGINTNNLLIVDQKPQIKFDSAADFPDITLKQEIPKGLVKESEWDASKNTVSDSRINEKLIPAQESKPSINKEYAVLTTLEESQKKYRSALSLYNQGEIQHAKLLLLETLKLSSNHIDARRLLALIHLKDDHLNLAKAVITKGLLDKPFNQKLLRLYLQVCVEEGNFTEAIITMEKSNLISSPEDIAYLAGLYQKIDDHAKSVELYSQALRSKPNYSVWWMGKGISLEALMKNEEALTAYKASRSFGGLTSSLESYVLSRIRTIEDPKINIKS